MKRYVVPGLCSERGRAVLSLPHVSGYQPHGPLAKNAWKFARTPVVNVRQLPGGYERGHMAIRVWLWSSKLLVRNPTRSNSVVAIQPVTGAA